MVTEISTAAIAHAHLTVTWMLIIIHKYRRCW